MNYFIQTTLAPSKLFHLAGDVNAFKTWLLETHNKQYDMEIITGHRFFLECAFTSIFHSIIYSEVVPFKHDRLLELASNTNLIIDKLPGDGDRRIILKNLYRHYLQLTNAATEADLRSVIGEIKTKIVAQLNQFYDTNFKLKKHIKLEKKEFDNILLIDHLVVYYNQIGIGPYAHQEDLLDESIVSKEKMEVSFEGYKYIVQYLYSLVLPADVFIKAEINKMHEADSWQRYIVNDQDDGETDPLFRALNETFDIEKQKCFESYFYRVNNLMNIETPKRYGIQYINAESHLVALKKKIPKAMFTGLLDPAVKQYDIKQTPIEKRYYNLQWYPVDVSNILDANEFNGVAAFNTLLIGTLAVTDKGFVYVNKWKHSTDDPERNYYSYAVLLNTSKTSARDGKGWMLFFDCCNDFTGSRSNFLAIEKILKDNKRRIHLSVEELGYEEFTTYLKNYVPDKDHLISNEILSLRQIAKTKENKELFDKYQRARGTLLELLCYYAVSNHKDYADFTIKGWSKMVEGKDIDVLLESKSQIILIECKYNGKGRTFNLIQRIEELNEVVRKRKEELKINNGTIEFWFWLPPSEKDITLLENKNIKYEIFGAERPTSEYKNLIKLKKMRDIFTLSFDQKELKTNAKKA